MVRVLILLIALAFHLIPSSEEALQYLPVKFRLPEWLTRAWVHVHRSCDRCLSLVAQESLAFAGNFWCQTPPIAMASPTAPLHPAKYIEVSTFDADTTTFLLLIGISFVFPSRRVADSGAGPPYLTWLACPFIISFTLRTEHTAT